MYQKADHFFSVLLCIVFPLGNESLHIGGQFAFKMYVLPACGVYDAQSAGVQGLAWAYLKAFFYKMFVFAEYSAFHDFVAAIGFVAEKWVSDMAEVYADLVRAAGFEFALY